MLLVKMKRKYQLIIINTDQKFHSIFLIPRQIDHCQTIITHVQQRLQIIIILQRVKI